eukprot:37126-Prorocentrum_minimum.AAC.2
MQGRVPLVHEAGSEHGPVRGHPRGPHVVQPQRERHAGEDRLRLARHVRPHLRIRCAKVHHRHLRYSEEYRVAHFSDSEDSSVTTESVKRGPPVSKSTLIERSGCSIAVLSADPDRSIKVDSLTGGEGGPCRRVRLAHPHLVPHLAVEGQQVAHAHELQGHADFGRRDALAEQVRWLVDAWFGHQREGVRELGAHAHEGDVHVVARPHDHPVRGHPLRSRRPKGVGGKLKRSSDETA